MKSTMNKLLAFLISGLLALGFGYGCLMVPSINSRIAAHGNLNLLTYGMVIVLFCVLYLITYAITCRLTFLENQKGSVGMLLLAILIFLGNLAFFLRMFQLEQNVYGGVADRYVWHKLPLWLVLLFLACELIFFFLCVRGGSVALPDSAMYLVYGGLSLLLGYTFYTPSIFVRGESDRLHANAYFNSIYNVLHGSPYSEHTTSIYGHYGILYRLPLKLLGGDYIDFILLNAVLGALCFLAMFLALHLMVKHNLLRLLGAIAMTLPILAMRGGYYWQLWPHRILFMSLMICYVAFCVHFQKFNKVTCLVGYGLAFLGIIWNTESGMFCAIAWSGFWILRYFCKERVKVTSAMVTILLHLFGSGASFLAAFGVVNLYNLMEGGTANSLREFVFPLMTTSYMDDLLMIALPDFPSAYVPVLILLLLSVAWGISYMSFFHGKDQSRNLTKISLACFAFFTGVLTLGQTSYFMNRAAYHNLDVCHLPAILLICMLTERGMYFIKRFHWKDWKKYGSAELFQGAFTLTGLGLLLTLVTGTLVQYGYNTDLKTQFHGKEEIHAFANEIGESIPENTYAFGIGVSEIYAMLRWDTQVYTLDFADLSVRPQAGNYVISDIREKDISDFLVGENTMKKLENFSPQQYKWLKSQYKATKEFKFQGAVFTYYEKK